MLLSLILTVAGALAPLHAAGKEPPPIISLEKIASVIGPQKVQIGPTIVDLRAPGAPLLLKALEKQTAVIGIFDPARVEILNALLFGEGKIDGHKSALAALAVEARPPIPGGYTFWLKTNGTPIYRPSDSLKVPLTEQVKQAIRIYFGVRPAN